MQMQEECGEIKLNTDYSVYQISRDGSYEEKQISLLNEHVMEVSINGQVITKMVCTPQYPVELVLGWMYGEGFIDDSSEVEEISIDKRVQKVNVRLVCYPKKAKISLFPVASMPCKLEWIWKLADLFAQDTPLHRCTSSTHSCFLMTGGEIIFQCEDIGRHNALDKTIGYALRKNIDLAHCVIYSSGRMPIDMVKKVIRAGIPILISKEHPTGEAIELARKYRLILIGRCKNGKFLLYTGKFDVCQINKEQMIYHK